jgi:hypothetical protein
MDPENGNSICEDSKEIFENIDPNSVSQMDIDEMYELMDKIKLEANNQIDNKYSEEEVDSIFNEIINSSNVESTDTDNSFFTISSDKVISLESNDCKNTFESLTELESYIKNKVKFDGTFYRFYLNKETYNVCLVMRTVDKIIEIVKEKHISYTKN